MCRSSEDLLGVRRPRSARQLNARKSTPGLRDGPCGRAPDESEAAVKVRNGVSWPSTVAVLLVACLAVAAGTPSQRLSIALGAAASFSPTSLGPSAILSPDGHAFAFVAQSAEGAKPQLYVQRIGQARATLRAGTEGADSPFFSPDGKWIGFFAGATLKKIAMAGGPPVTICSVGIAAGKCPRRDVGRRRQHLLLAVGSVRTGAGVVRRRIA